MPIWGCNSEPDAEEGQTVFCKAKEKPMLKTHIPAPRPSRKNLQEETLLCCIEHFAGKRLPSYEAEALITLAKAIVVGVSKDG